MIEDKEIVLTAPPVDDPLEVGVVWVQKRLETQVRNSLQKRDSPLKGVMKICTHITVVTKIAKLDTKPKLYARLTF